jgi:hypothetical protein
MQVLLSKFWHRRETQESAGQVVHIRMITLLAFTGLKNLNIDGACMNSVPILGQ